jgi:hypothetical protein
MSSPKQELGLIREFRELHSYVSQLGHQFNLIYKRLESLEIQLIQISTKFDESTAVNRKEIGIIQQKMFTKSEFIEFVNELQITVEEKLPNLLSSSTTTLEIKEPTSQGTEESLPQSKTTEEQREGIFSWGRRNSTKDS